MNQLEQFLHILPFLGVFAGVLWYYVRKEMKATDSAWEKEEERKAKVAALSPQPSYEERMGVQYGSTGTNE